MTHYDPMLYLQMALSQLATLAIAFACLVLWLKRRSGWALVALIGECASLVCSLAYMLAPQVFSGMHLSMLWPLNALVFAAGLLGYACLDAPTRESRAPASGTAP